eukprot:COSAG02_NODE_415_length_22762_cov_133.681816_26_plen_102_part_00
MMQMRSKIQYTSHHAFFFSFLFFFCFLSFFFFLSVLLFFSLVTPAKIAEISLGTSPSASSSDGSIATANERKPDQPRRQLSQDAEQRNIRRLAICNERART